MILEKQTEGLILEEGIVQESTSMVIDAESHIFLMRMLSKFYSDAIGSLIRETASNALDSHRKSNVSEPIIVGLKNVNGNLEFSVEDFGEGIDDVIVENVIKKYGKSTKRNDAKALGAFGLGFKSPLAYGPSFYFTGRKNGVERKWMMYEAEDEQNKIDLLYEKATTERNGVKIIVPVKYSDRNSFLSKIEEQLCYFEDVYFDCENLIKNDFSIIRHENFQWSPICSNSYLHICLDNVYYPIDWSKLGISALNIPIGLKFSLSDGIFPLPNRETLKYTEEAKKIILDKITKIADYFIEKYNEKVVDTDDIDFVFDYMSSSNRPFQGYGACNWELTSLKLYSNILFKTPKLKGVKKLNLQRLYTMRDTLVNQYSKSYEYRNSRFVNISEKRWSKELSYHGNGSSEMYIFSGTLNKLKKDYFRDILGNKFVYFIKNTGTFPLKGNSVSKNVDRSFYNILQLKNYPKSDWREIIKEFQYVQSLKTKNFIDADAFEIPADWIEGRKKKKVAIMAQNGTNVRRKKLTGEVSGKVAKPLERYVSGKNCKLETVTINMKDAYKQKVFTVYGNQDIEDKVQKYFNIFKKDIVRFVIFSERELKNLKDLELHNWMTMEEFEKGKHIIYKRAVTAYLIQRLVDKNTYTFNKMEVFKEVSLDLQAKLKSLYDYKNKYYLRGDSALYEDMLKIAEEKNLFDPLMYSLYLEITKTLSKLPFLNQLMGVYPYATSIQPELLEVLRNLFKYYKLKIDWIHYSVKLNEESKEQLTDLVDQLTETI